MYPRRVRRNKPEQTFYIVLKVRGDRQDREVGVTVTEIRPDKYVVA